MSKVLFGQAKTGEDVTKYTLRNANGMEVDLIDLGATIVAIRVAGKDGRVRDVVLGYEKVSDYERGQGYLGAIVGRNANRIEHSQVVIDGVVYPLQDNDRGNNLHSGDNGVSFRVWSVKEADDKHIVFTIVNEEMPNDFPGTVQMQVVYSLSDENELTIAYHATADKKTVINMTNHAYFNLNGQDSGVAEDQKLQIFASHYIPVKDEKCIPTGEIAEVANTPLDFRQMTVIGDRIRDDYDQLKYVGGYDHCYIADKEDNAYGLVAVAQSDVSGIRMEVFTDALGIQFYAGNFIGEQVGKDGAIYNDRHGYALETGYAPNSANETNFKQPIFAPGEVYETKTTYQFSVM